MWLEIKGKEILGIHSEMPSKSDYELIEVDNATTLDLKKWYTKEKGIHEPILTKTQKKVNDKNRNIKEALQYLKDTDYIITKISESIITNNDKLRDDLLSKYKDIITKRNEYRKLLG